MRPEAPSACHRHVFRDRARRRLRWSLRWRGTAPRGRSRGCHWRRPPLPTLQLFLLRQHGRHHHRRRASDALENECHYAFTQQLHRWVGVVRPLPRIERHLTTGWERLSPNAATGSTAAWQQELCDPWLHNVIQWPRTLRFGCPHPIRLCRVDGAGLSGDSGTLGATWGLAAAVCRVGVWPGGLF